MNLRTEQQQSCRQVTLRINTMIQDVRVYSAFLPDQSVLKFCSTATRSQCRRCRRPAPTPLYPTRPVYESSFWTSKAVYETSHNQPTDGSAACNYCCRPVAAGLDGYLCRRRTEIAQCRQTREATMALADLVAATAANPHTEN